VKETHNVDEMYELGGGEVFILCFVALVFVLGIYTLVRFLRSKN
jgi:hypothetical protein